MNTQCVNDNSQTLDAMKKSSHDLKQRIEEEKRRNEMPVNSSLGDPKVDARNAHGHNDLPDQDDV